MSNDITRVNTIVTARIDHGAPRPVNGVPDLKAAVKAFIRRMPDKRHFVLSATPEETEKELRSLFPFLRHDQLQVAHPFEGTVGWVQTEPNCALSCMVIIEAALEYAMICSRLRNEDAVFYVWGKFDATTFNNSLVKHMSPHLFTRSDGKLHLYTGLKAWDLPRGLPSPRSFLLLGD